MFGVFAARRGFAPRSSSPRWSAGSRLPGPEDAKVAELRATVEAVQDGRARIRFTDSFEAIKELKDEPQMSYRGVASATGMAVYDVKDKRMTSLLLYLQGTSESWPKAKGKHDIGAVIEWQWERASPR